MTEQPTALRLADALDCVTDDNCGYCMPCSVGAELRRLHAENQRCRSVCDATSEGWRADAEEWKAQRPAEPVQEAGFWGRVAARQASRIKQLETAAQQALEALEYYRSGEDHQPTLASESITALRTALEQQQAEPPPEWPLIKNILAVFGLGQATTDVGVPVYVVKKVEPVQEPVAWHYTNNGGGNVMHWGPSARLDADIQAAKDYPRVHKVTPLYTAPPQRKPLSEVDLRALYDRHAACQEEGPEISGWWDFARAVEAAHGIKEGT